MLAEGVYSRPQPSRQDSYPRRIRRCRHRSDRRRRRRVFSPAARCRLGRHRRRLKLRLVPGSCDLCLPASSPRVLAYPASMEATTSFAHFAFHRVTAAASPCWCWWLELIWVCRHLELTHSKRDLRLRTALADIFVRAQLCSGALIGTLSAGLGAAFLLLSTGLRVKRSGASCPSALAGYLRIFAVGLGSGLSRWR